MAPAKIQNEHLEQSEHPEHEAALSGALALANLFSNCVEAFGLIHPVHKWEKEEQLLLSRLGIQQARLLIWGDTIGISSPPKTVTDRAVPKHPSAAYPDLKEPTFFGARDERLDDTEIRKQVEDALGAIVDRSAGSSREEMMDKYGLKPPKRFTIMHDQPLDAQRLDGFREKYELLREVAETYAQLNTRRNNSIVQTTWQIADYGRFATFIQLTQEKIDFLINLMDVKDRIDRGMRMDIKAFGWHLTNDRQRVASDVSKLRLLQEVCKQDYPEYVAATQTALNNISREARENAPSVNIYALPPPSAAPAVKAPQANGGTKQKRPSGFLGLFKKLKSQDKVSKGSSQSIAEPPRSLSDAGPTTSNVSNDDDEDDMVLRSKSVGDILDTPGLTQDDEFIRNKLEMMRTQTEDVNAGNESLGTAETIGSVISRHDQYHGIARTETKDLNQGW